jgi:hypothetical protein
MGQQAASQPLWVIGAPRSGTTFFGAMLDRHPEITLSNESRVFVWMKQAIEVDCARPDIIEPEHRERFTRFLKREGGGLIERYYREELGVKTRIWGDKHPPYSDPTLLSGREGTPENQGARPREPRSGSALRLIRELLPESKFIHLRRDAEEVAQSLVSRKWIASVAFGMDVWRQYIAEIEGFLAELPPDRHLTVEYATLLQSPAEAAGAVARFLEVDAAPLTAFLEAERAAPTPYSAPVRDLASTAYAPPA